VRQAGKVAGNAAAIFRGKGLVMRSLRVERRLLMEPPALAITFTPSARAPVQIRVTFDIDGEIWCIEKASARCSAANVR